jgi:hypothetical protein
MLVLSKPHTGKAAWFPLSLAAEQYGTGVDEGIRRGRRWRSTDSDAAVRSKYHTEGNRVKAEDKNAHLYPVDSSAKKRSGPLWLTAAHMSSAFSTPLPLAS